MDKTIVFSNGEVLGVDRYNNISIVGGIQVKEYNPAYDQEVKDEN